MGSCQTLWVMRVGPCHEFAFLIDVCGQILREPNESLGRAKNQQVVLIFVLYSNLPPESLRTSGYYKVFAS